MSAPSQNSKKPSALASCILLGLILGAVGAVGGGGFWAYKKFIAKKDVAVAPPVEELDMKAVAAAAKAAAEKRAAEEAKKPTGQKPADEDAKALAEAKSVAEEKAARENAQEEARRIANLNRVPVPAEVPETNDKPVDPKIAEVPQDIPADPVVPVEPVVSFSNDAPEVDQLKADADRRIDGAPTEIYSDADKEKVREAIRLAKRLTRIAILQFGTGSQVLGAKEQARFQNALNSPEVEPLLADPQAVFFIIGFADASGASSTNRSLSQKRAAGVGSLLKGFKVKNRCYAVGIGASSLISAEQQSKNRAAEVWIVLP